MSDEQTQVAETDGQLLQRLGDDASKWAAEFRRVAIHLGYSDMDEGWLTGWFTNAIEHSEITRRERDKYRLGSGRDNGFVVCGIFMGAACLVLHQVLS